MKYIFFITKIGSLYHVVLPLLEEKQKKGDILIIAGSQEVEDFLTQYTKYSVVRMKVNPNLITRSSKKNLVSRLFQAKREYRLFFNEMKGAEVFFFGNSFSIVVFYYIQKLSKNNTVYHCGSPGKEASVAYPEDHGFRAYVLKWIARWMLGVDTTIHTNQGVPFWRLDESFYQKHGIKEKIVEGKPSITSLPTFDFLDNKEVLITMQDLLVYDYVTRESFIEILDELMSFLDKLAPNRYSIKPHPHENTLYGAMSQSTHIAPSYIPSEFLMDHPWKLILGIFSTSLVSASDMTQAKVISLIDLFDWNDNKRKNEWKKVMDNGAILFPQTLDELKHKIKKVLQ